MEKTKLMVTGRVKTEFNQEDGHMVVVVKDLE